MGDIAVADRRAAHVVRETDRGRGAAASEGGGDVSGARPSDGRGDQAGAAPGAVFGESGGDPQAAAAVGGAYAGGAAGGWVFRRGDRRVGGGESGWGWVSDWTLSVSTMLTHEPISLTVPLRQ